MDTRSPTADSWVGIDVSKTHLDIALLPAAVTFQVANSHAGWTTLVTRLRGITPTSIVLEATGRYHRGVTAALAAVEMPPAIINPSWTHAFAKSEGRRAKTDRTDAQVLARYAQQKQPAPTAVPTATTRTLTDLTAYRDDLVTMRTMEKNRATVMTGVVAPFIAAHIAELDARIAALAREIAALIATDPFWTARVALLTSVPGLSTVLGPQVAVGLIELGDGDRRTIASLAGVAPHPQESGQHRGYRAVRGGRPVIRRALYLMALTAVRRDPVMRAHYQHLLAGGKKKKVALIACARRMLGIINAMIRDGLTWQQTRVGQGQFLADTT